MAKKSDKSTGSKKGSAPESKPKTTKTMKTVDRPAKAERKSASSAPASKKAKSGTGKSGTGKSGTTRLDTVKMTEAKLTKPAKASKKKSASKNTGDGRLAATVIEPGTDKATKKQAEKSKAQQESFAAALRVEAGFQLADVDAGATPAFEGGHKAAKKLMAATAEELSDLQERLYAGQRHPDGRSVLLVVQGMDTSGKGGIMRHVVGQVDPQGVHITSFKTPTKEELSHPFLWRIRRALPEPGFLGVFDRSHYEDVLIARVHDLVARPVWMRRYGQINSFEASTVAKNTTVIKVMLHIDADEQKKRLGERLDNPEKFYKFNPNDVTERSYWSEYQEAYQAVLERTSTDYAPWYVVPANHKWYARLAVQQILLEHLRALDLAWPAADFDVEEQRKRLAKS